ncbi:Protein gts1 [Lithohypha guttulata]|uniref:Protein gts1 n=1 Tax=Lithohypha guttulata TaxID=1690604 RepID=A0AAN7SVM6_9EURO|nr:Protein gts1 [Lithohypha guttulata]
MASLSKREQARNERELQDLLRVPGNSQCADCGARNPSWASWNLGIFVCMRCASIHRKLGTHISKVKSLSMDKWSSEQVESMKQRGNTASNKIYNPKNKRPDIPLDADEVDSAMERYIRKKYQEKSLVDGRPEPPSRAEPSPSLNQAPSYSSPVPDLPTAGKKHKFFGFSLRTSSKKDRPGMNDAFRITPVEYSPTSGTTREVPELELQEKLGQLRDMGFRDNERNLNILKRSGGDIERTIATLVKMGPSDPTPGPRPSPPPSQATEPSAPAPAATSNNPFDQLDQQQGQQGSSFGLSFDMSRKSSQPQQPPPSANPWQAAMPAQNRGLEQQFANMQVSNTLFPHHTGGYTGPSAYQDLRLQNMTPPVPALPQQYGSASPTSNPFYHQQQPMSSQSTGNNPFLQQQQSQPVFAPSFANNPFLAMQQPHSQNGSNSSNNPFGIALAQQQSQSSAQQFTQVQQPQTQNMNPYGFVPQNSHPSFQPSQFSSQQMPPYTQQTTQSPQSQIPNFDYGQPQSQSQLQSSQSTPGHSQPQAQPGYYQNQQFQAQPQPLQPQATGRYTKNDILALFNAPTSFQTQSLAPVQEAQDDNTSQQQQQQRQQIVSPVPSNNPYGNPATLPGKRAATMPVSSMHSSGGHTIGSRNPFLTVQGGSNNNNNTFGAGQQQQQQQQQGYGTWQQQGARHASNESVSVNNPSLVDGRHSPDAFASLSSRY